MLEKAYSLYSVSIGNGAAVLRSDPDTEPDSAGQWIGDDIVYQDTPLWGEPVYFEGGVTPVPVEFLPREQGGLYISHLIPREPMVIADEPDSVIAEFGTQITFRIFVTGTGPFAYQWFKDGVVVSDAQTPTLTVEASWENAGVYTCKVTDGVDLIDSAPATLVITTPPQEGEDVEGVSPEGEPEGDTPVEGQPAEGESVEGEPVEGIQPEGETVEGNVPEGIAPEGLPVEGLSPEGSIPEGELPEGQSSEGQPSEGEISEGVPAEGEAGEGQPSEGFSMEGQVEGDTAPDGGNEEGDAPAANNITVTGCFGA
jgi:hypothetical protein